MRDLAREVSRLLGRARRRWEVVLGLSILMTAGAMGFIARKAIFHEAKVVVRVTEIADTPKSTPSWTNRDLRARIYEVAFSSENLLDLMQRLGMINPRSKKFDAQSELEDFRELMTLEVFQNQVLSLLDPNERPSAARVLITFRATSRDEALKVVQGLAELVIKTSGGERRAQLLGTSKQVAAAIAAAKQELETIVAENTRIAAGLSPSQAAVQRLRMTSELEAMQKRISAFEEERRQIERSLSADRAAGGLELEALEARTGPPPLPRGARVALMGLASIVLGMPLCALVLGAFTRTVYDPRDVEHLGMTCLGLVPAEPYAQIRGTNRAAEGPV